MTVWYWVIAQNTPGVPGALLGAWWNSPEVWVPVVLFGGMLLGVLALVLFKRRRERRIGEVFDQLVADARFEPIEDKAHRQELRQWVHWLLTGDAAPMHEPMPLVHAVQYRTQRFVVSVVHVAAKRANDLTETPVSSTVVVCDGFDVPLPSFRLMPSNFVLRQAAGQGVFPRDTAFGRHNLVFTDEPHRTRHVLDEEAQALLDGNKAVAVECMPERVLLYRHDHKLRPEQLIPFVEDCVTLAQIVRDNAHTAPVEPGDEPEADEPK